MRTSRFVSPVSPLAPLALLAVTCAAGCSHTGGDAAVEHTGATAAPLGACDGTWTVVDSPNVGGQDNSLAWVAGAATNDVWAVGQYAPDANPNMTLSLAMHYDGTTWSVVPTPNFGSRANALLSVAAVPSRAWAVGYYIGSDFLSHSLILAWNGHEWDVVPHPQPFATENLYGVAAISPGDVWAVGSGRDGEGAFHAIALHFDGSAWSVVHTPDAGDGGNVLYGVSARATDDVWAVGQKIDDAGPDQALVLRWNGARWSEVAAAPAGDASGQLIAVATVAERGDVRAVGDLQDGVVSLRTFAETAERGFFSRPSTANPSVRDDRLTGVAAPSDHESWAVGSYLDADSGNLRTLIETGSETGAWTQVDSPSPATDGDNQLAAVASVGAHDLWAVGAFDGPDAAQTLIVHRCK
jgi:hypothetical protein